MSLRVHLIAGFIHKDICEQMVETAKEVSTELDCKIDRIVWVPGSLEASLVVQQLIEYDRPDAIVVFGVQEQGKTKHGEVIAHQVTSKLLDLQLAYRLPMAIGIIGPGASLEHAAGKARYVSQKAMRAAAHMVTFINDLHSDHTSEI